MRTILACAFSLVAIGRADAATLRFWNLTANTITALAVSPPGADRWSGNLCLSDPDHAVDPDERLGLPGVAPGIYDVRVADSANRHCTLRAVVLKPAGHYALSISEEEMRSCH